MTHGIPLTPTVHEAPAYFEKYKAGIAGPNMMSEKSNGCNPGKIDNVRGW